MIELSCSCKRRDCHNTSQKQQNSHLSHFNIPIYSNRL